MPANRPTSTESFSSLASLGIDNILASAGEHGPDLLRVPLSLSLVPDLSSDSVPPFPPQSRPPMTAVLGLGIHLPLFPNGLKRIDRFCDDAKCATTTITGPTSPRLRLMLKETLCIMKWAESIPPLDAPGHIPWAGTGEAGPLTWTPEGSLFPPEEFQSFLSNTRRSSHRMSGMRDTQSPFTNEGDYTLTPSTDVRRRSSLFPTSPSFREAHVFESQVTLGPPGERKRWSLQAPAARMNSEMVDMVLELQDLASLFENGFDDAARPAESLGDWRHDPPVLVVSDSTSAIPLSFSPSTTLELEGGPTACQGRADLASRNVKMGTKCDPYLEIPSAFLRASECSTKKDGCVATISSLGLEEMVANLRSKCASMCDFSAAVIEGAEQGANTRTAAISSTADDEDEWAFADGLLSDLRVTDVKGDTLVHTPALLQADPYRQSDHARPRPKPDTESATLPSVRRRYSDAGRGMASSPLSSLPPTMPPSSPLPRPPPNSRLAPIPVRGILKSAKNVRFASLPSRSDTALSPVKSRVFSEQQRPTFDTAAPRPPPRAPRAKLAWHAPVRPGDAASPSPPAKRGARVTTPSSIRSAAAVVSRTWSNASPSPIAQALRPRNECFSNTGIAKEILRPALLTNGRHSLGSATASKENRARAFSSPLVSSRWSSAVVNEDRGRRAGARESATQKSRMPVPLRNILTRFK